MSYWLMLRYKSSGKIEEKDKKTKKLIRNYGGRIKSLDMGNKDVSHYCALFNGDWNKANVVSGRILSRLDGLVKDVIIIPTN